jgi:hypothetical protein
LVKVAEKTLEFVRGTIYVLRGLGRTFRAWHLKEGFLVPRNKNAGDHYLRYF